MKKEEIGGTLDVMYENNKAKIKQTNKRKKRKAESIPIHRREKSDSPNH